MIAQYQTVWGCVAHPPSNQIDPSFATLENKKLKVPGGPEREGHDKRGPLKIFYWPLQDTIREAQAKGKGWTYDQY